MDSTEMNLLQEAVKEGFDPLEYRACQIALIYERLRREYFKEPYNCLNKRKDKRKSRGFPHFYKLAKLEKKHKDLLPDMALYLRGQFEVARLKAGSLLNDIPTPPQHLHTKMAFERYVEYIRQLQIQESLSTTRTRNPQAITKGLVDTHRLLSNLYRDIFGKEGLDFKQILEYTREEGEYSLFPLLLKQGLVSRFFLCGSVHYLAWCCNLQDPEIPQSKDLLPYQQELLQEPSCLDLARSLFGAEFRL